MNMESKLKIGSDRVLDFEEESIPLFDPKETGVGPFLTEPPPQREFLIKDLLPSDIAALTIGRGGVGKSSFVLQLCGAVASGRNLYNDRLEICTTGTTLYIAAEDDHAELHRRCFHAFKEFPETAKKLIAKKMHVVSMVGEETLLTQKEEHGEVVETALFNRLLTTCGSYKNLKLIVIDPASRFRGGDENFAVDTTRFVQVCEKLAKVTGATVLIVHHSNKVARGQKQVDQNDARGSSALVDGVRWVANITALSDSQLKEYGISVAQSVFFTSFKVTKNNYAPPQHEPLILKRGDHGVLELADVQNKKSLADAGLKMGIRAEVSQAQKSGAPHSLTSLTKALAGKSKRSGLGKDKMKEQIQSLIREGVLEKRDATVGEKKTNPNLRSVIVKAESIESEFGRYTSARSQS